MTLDLGEPEARALERALSNYLPELAAEAARTERVADAHVIWEEHRRLEAVARRLRALLDGAEARVQAL